MLLKKISVLVLLMLAMMSCDSSAHNSHDFENTKEYNFVWDKNGYIFFNLCMGRIGNKIDHFLGGLAFAKSVNRTLVLPPIRTYKNIPFEEYFQVEPLREYHSVITAEDFLQHLAPTYWPPGKRIGFCSGWHNKDGKLWCEMGGGNPHGPFWEDLNISFDDTIPHQLGHYSHEEWKETFPASKYPVLAMRGPPAVYPMEKKYYPLQKYLRPARHIEEEAEHYIHTKLLDKEFIGIHLRNGPDWENACKSAGQSVGGKYMSSPQCTDINPTAEMCLPSQQTILRHLADVVHRTNIFTVFAATDKDPMIQAIQNYFQNKVVVYHLDPHEPMVDQAVLIRSTHFIGNCVSSFTAFVTRTRLIQGKDTSFWGQLPD